MNDVPIRFVGRILRNREIIYSKDEPERVRWESLHRRMADDVEVWAGPLDRALLKRAAEGRD